MLKKRKYSVETVTQVWWCTATQAQNQSPLCLSASSYKFMFCKQHVSEMQEEDEDIPLAILTLTVLPLISAALSPPAPLLSCRTSILSVTRT